MIAPIDTVFVEVADHSAWHEPATWIGLIGVAAGPVVAWLIGVRQVEVRKGQIASQLRVAEQQVDTQLAAAREQIAADLRISERQILASVRSTARLKWIDDIRAATADLAATATMLNTALWHWRDKGRYDDAQDDPHIAELTYRFLQRRQAIRMWLNLEKPDQLALDDAVNRLNDLLGTPTLVDSKVWSAAVHYVILTAKVVFDAHWERAKMGE